ncbi:MAG TPA: hypothetical protein PLV21_18055 [Cyclobacteriaceae bacterium]|nr:hypothetical protein [Cyclobacteriaceae bacterium]HRJ83795.1 hypothetical protein [Cyclobacteriaceae bacterium]
MEELDDLKSIWKQQSGYEAKNEAEIIEMLSKRSNTLIHKLKRSVWFELIFTLACMLVLGTYSVTLKGGALMWTILSLLVLLLSFTLYYVKKIILLNQYDAGHENLKDNLNHLLLRLDAYMKFYKRSYSILYPLFFALGLLFGALESGFDRFIEKFEKPMYTLSFIILSVVFMAGVYKITDWYLKKLYGNHIEKLRSLQKELLG